MIQISEKSIFSTLIFLFACSILFATIDMHSDVALVPRIVGTGLLLFSGVQMLMDLFPAVRKRLSFLESKLTAEETFGGEGVVEEEAETGKSPFERYLFFGWVAAFVALIFFIGMIWAIAIAIFVYLKWINKDSWTLALIYSLGIALFIYLVFVVGFGFYYFL